MTTKSLVFSWALLSLCTLQCMALSDSQRADHSKREELQNLGSLLAESLRGSDRPKKEASAPVKEFFDKYFAAKEREQGTSMWNLIPINCTRRDLYADTIEVLESTTPGTLEHLHHRSYAYTRCPGCATVRRLFSTIEYRVLLPRRHV